MVFEELETHETGVSTVFDEGPILDNGCLQPPTIEDLEDQG